MKVVYTHSTTLLLMKEDVLKRVIFNCISYDSRRTGKEETNSSITQVQGKDTVASLIIPTNVFYNSLWTDRLFQSLVKFS